MPHVLFVCTANICRSPVAAALFKQQLDVNGRTPSDWVVQSAGTWATVVRGPARYSVQLLAEKGIDIRQHYAVMITEALLAQADLVLCMEVGHVEALRFEFPRYRNRVFTFSEMVGKPYSIPDPYGGPLKEYQQMLDEVEELITKGFERIVTLAEANAAQRVVN